MSRQNFMEKLLYGVAVEWMEFFEPQTTQKTRYVMMKSISVFSVYSVVNGIGGLV